MIIPTQKRKTNILMDAIFGVAPVIWGLHEILYCNFAIKAKKILKIALIYLNMFS